MNKMLWKRRIATLLTVCMAVMQFSVPAVAQSNPDVYENAIADMPSDYVTLENEKAMEVVDLEDVSEEDDAQVPEEASEDALQKSMEVYGSIPVVGTEADKTEEEEQIPSLRNENPAPEEEIVSEEEKPHRSYEVQPVGPLTLNQVTSVEILVPGVAQEYTFTPQETGEYVFSLWDIGYGIDPSCEIYNQDGFLLNYVVSSTTVMELEKDLTYSFQIDAWNSGYANFILSSVTSISSDTATVVNGAAKYNPGGELGEASFAELTIGSANGEDYIVYCMGETYEKTSANTYNFYNDGSSTIYIFNKNGTTDTLTVSAVMSRVPTVNNLGNTAITLKPVKKQNQEECKQIKLRVSPPQDGTYVFSYDNLSVYSLSPGLSCFTNEYDSRIFLDYAKGEEYEIDGFEILLETIGDVCSYDVNLTEIPKHSITYNETKTISFGDSKYGWVEVTVPDNGLYELQLLGEAHALEYKIRHDGADEVAYAHKSKEGKNTHAIVTPSQDKTCNIYVLDYGKELLGDVVVGLKASPAALTADEEGYAGYRQGVLKADGTTWMTFTPQKSGDYILCTEKKYNNADASAYLYTGETGILQQCTYWYGSDNVEIQASLEAGVTYYLAIRQYGDEEDEDEIVNFVAYPVTVIDDYTLGTTATTEMRKGVTYEVEVPKAGFYSVSVDGMEESYFLDVKNAEDEEDDYDNVTSFVYSEIPRVFLFEKAGTYQIKVSKELMSDEMDEISFSVSEGGSASELTLDQEQEITMDSTDGKWMKFVPEETGWYLFRGLWEDDEENGEYYSYFTSLSVENMEGTEIIYTANSGTLHGYGAVSHLYKLEAGRTCYFRLTEEDSQTGQKVKVEVEGISNTNSADDETIPSEIFAQGGMVRFTTNFSQRKELVLSVPSTVYFKDITAGVNKAVKSFNSTTKKFIFPAGEKEYLFLSPYGKVDIQVSPLEVNAIETNSVLLNMTKDNNTQWVKFVPEETGMYNLSAVVTEGNADTRIYNYKVNGVNLSRLSTVGEGSNYSLTAGTTYYASIKASAMEGDGCKVSFRLSKLDIEGKIFSLGTNTVSTADAWMATFEKPEPGHYSISGEGGTFHISIFGTRGEKYNKLKSLEISDTSQTIEIYDWSFYEEFYVLVTKDVSTEQDEELTINFEKIPIIQKEIAYGDEIDVEAGKAYEEYTFMPEESGNYAFIIGTDGELSSDDMDFFEVDEYDELYDANVGESWNNLKKDYEVESIQILEADRRYPYKIVIKTDDAYHIKVTTAGKKYIYDYDEMNAFVASGGRIYIADEITDDMRDKADEWGELDFVRTNDNKYYCFDASEFKNSNDIWLPNYYQWITVEEGVHSFGEIRNFALHSSKWDYSPEHGLVIPHNYLTKTMYVLNDDLMGTPVQKKDSDALTGDTILMGYREPEVVLNQKVTLTGLTAMEVGQTSKLTYTTSTLNQYQPTTPGVTFSSDKPSVVSVDASGNIVAKGAGTAVITCRTKDGNAKATLTIKVKKNIVTAVSVTISGGKSELFVGDEIQLSATIGTNGQGKPTVDGVKWSTSDADIATVDPDGNVIAQGVGTVTITATSKDGYAKNSITIEVKPILAKKVTLNETNLRMKKGSSYKWLEATVSPKNTTDKSLKWSSSNKKVATVSSKGVIKAKAVGTATITVKTENGKKDTVKVTVTASSIKVKKIIVPKKLTAIAGEVIRLQPEIEPVNATNSKVSYDSSNEDVATVTKAGIVTAKGEGKATITVMSKDGTNKKATCVITVKTSDKPKFSKVKSEKKKTATLTWEQVDNADGYIIYMATSKKGPYKKAATIKNNKTTTYTVKKLKSKKKYYFKIVSYTNVGKKQVESKDSTIKNIKIK